MDIDYHQRYLKLNRFEIRLHHFLFTFESYSVSILSLQRAMFLKQRVPLNKSKVWVWMNFNWQSATIFNNVECPVIRYSMCYNKLQLEKKKTCPSMCIMRSSTCFSFILGLKLLPVLLNLRFKDCCLTWGIKGAYICIVYTFL